MKKIIFLSFLFLSFLLYYFLFFSFHSFYFLLFSLYFWEHSVVTPTNIFFFDFWGQICFLLKWKIDINLSQIFYHSFLIYATCSKTIVLTIFFREVLECLPILKLKCVVWLLKCICMYLFAECRENLITFFSLSYWLICWFYFSTFSYLEHSFNNNVLVEVHLDLVRKHCNHFLGKLDHRCLFFAFIYSERV